jgi:hypothetical protein
VRLRRRPLPFWAAALLAATVTALVVGRLTADAAAERARWGATRPAAVVLRDVAAGHRFRPGDLAVRQLPVALLPRGALRHAPIGAVTTIDLRAGETLVDARLARSASAAAARLPAGTRGLAVPNASGIPVEVGDRVDLLATFDAQAAGDGPPTFAVAEGAVVVAVADDAVTVAVPRRVAPAVAYALTAGSVLLALSATSSRR